MPSSSFSREIPTMRAIPTWNWSPQNLTFLITNDTDYINASRLRLSENRTGKKLSLVDALGYSYSIKLGIKFLTGDREFSGMENVEYAK